MSIWFYFTIVVAILVGHDLYVKKMKNDVRLKELELEMRKLELGKQSSGEVDKM